VYLAAVDRVEKGEDFSGYEQGASYQNSPFFTKFIYQLTHRTRRFPPVLEKNFEKNIAL
jgi:hypothetical protein